LNTQKINSFNKQGLAFDKEGFGEGSTLGKLNIKEPNPGLSEQAYHQAYEILMEENITKSLAG
jgi:type I restriction enzyme R subunit